MNSLISIIVPIYNTEKYIRKCLDSILNQTYRNIEIILINDGSTDNSLSIMKEYQKKDKRIILIDKKNEGVSTTRNLGIEISKGEYLMFVDSDDFISDTYIEEMYEELQKNKYEIVISGMTLYNVEKNRKKVVSYKNENVEIKFTNIIPEIINAVTFCSSCKTLFKKTIINDNNIRFNTELKYGEDWLFSFNVLKNAKRIGYLNNNDYYYVSNSASAINKVNLESLYKYCDDNLYVLNYIEKNLNLKEKYLTSNRLLTKINFTINRLIFTEKIDYKIFKRETKNIYNKYIVNTKKIEHINLNKINYESKYNKIFLTLLYKRHLLSYYILLKIKKIIKR